MLENKKAVVVGISGCSSSGKTTLARLLRDIFPNTFILHEDDFYKPEDQLPIRDGLVDWDCAGSISVPDMEAALRHIHQTGTFPVSCSPSPSPNPLPHFAPPSCPSSSPSHRARRLSHRSSHGCISPPLPPSPSSTDRKLTNQTFVASKEDQNTVGACPVPESDISAQKSRVASWLGPGRPGRALLDSGTTICLLDGFLLYTPAVAPVMSSLDIKLFLLVSRDQATRRREARDGYVTLEGFWKDPPGYVDRIVWPNYAENHAWLFEDGNVEGRLREDVLRENGIRAQVGRGLDVDMSTTLEWAVGVIMEELESLVLGKGDSGAE